MGWSYGPIKRRKTKKIRVGQVYIGGDSPITVQSMTKTDTRNVRETIEQIKMLEDAKKCYAQIINVIPMVKKYNENAGNKYYHKYAKSKKGQRKRIIFIQYPAKPYKE
jgi:4-hydroxy-3-methylbut-2-en-1-yl diphosphate synthase IspG/GcpE